MHVLPNISRSKGNQTIKFGHRNIARKTFLLKNQTKNVVEKLATRPFSGKLKLSIPLDPWSKVLYTLTVSQVEGYRNIMKTRCRPFAFTSSSAILENKKSSGTSAPASFSA